MSLELQLEEGTTESGSQEGDLGDSTELTIPKIKIEVALYSALQRYLAMELDIKGGMPTKDDIIKLLKDDRLIDRLAFRFLRVAGQAYMISLTKPGDIGVEIGCHCGDSSYEFALRQPKFLHLVDPYISGTENDGWTGPQVAQDTIDRRMMVMKKRLEPFNNWKHHHKTSDAFFSTYNEQIDWCYVDGNHNYEYAYRDCKNAWALIKPGGYLFVDDCRDGQWGPEVSKAMVDAIQESPWEYELVSTESDPAIIRKKA